MKKTILTVISLSFIALPNFANAALIEFLWDYNSPSLTGITTQDGIEIQNVNVGSEYTGNFGLFNSEVLVADTNFAFNIFSGTGDLLHTWEISGVAGGSSLAWPFLNSELGPLTPLLGATDFVADGSIQTVGSFSTANDEYILKFRTNISAEAVPVPPTIALFALGVLVLGLRRFKTGA